MIAYDGPGDQLGEEGDVQAEIQGVALRPHRAPVHVHEIGNGLEGEKGDADGQVHRAKGHPGQADEGEHLVEVVDKEASVLEKSEQNQVEAHAETQRRPAGARRPKVVDEEARNEIAEDGGEHHQQVDPLAPGVEQQTGDKEQDVARPPPGATVQEKHRGQEKEEKGDGAENHDEPRRVGGGGSALSARRVPGAGRVVQPDFPCPGKDECGPRNPGKASGQHGGTYSLTETMGLAAAVGGRNRCPVIMPLVVPKAATSQATSRPA